MRVSIEVCVPSVEEALAAARLGIDSVELCSWLACGGVTPSYGMVNTVKERLTLPVRVLVRPRPGDFLYTDDERQVILRDVMLIGMSQVGLVAGALDAEGMPSVPMLKAMRMAAPDNEITFHRAIDHAQDLAAAVGICGEHGVRRILTSGGATLAVEALDMLRAMVEGAGEHIRIAVAGGVGPANVVRIVEATGAREVHFAAQRTIGEPTDKAAMSSTYAGMSFRTTLDEAKVEGVLEALTNAGLR